MTERLLILAARGIAGGVIETMADARARLTYWRGAIQRLIDRREDNPPELVASWHRIVADCDAWFAAADAVKVEPLCLCPATSEYDPPCPRHGVLGIGVTGAR